MTDRRVQKTRKALHEALVSLLKEKKYEWIVVQDILNRANVGRSTFYLHYRDKDELLVDGLNDLRETLRQAQKSTSGAPKNHEKVIGFSLALFDHAYDHRNIYKMLVGSSGWELFRTRMEEILILLIQKEAKLYKKKSSTGHSFELLTYFVASSFLTVWNWWLNQKRILPPNEINSLFREMVLPVLQAHLT